MEGAINMSVSRLLINFSICVCMVAGTVSFSGCDKVPTWDEVSGNKKEEVKKPKPQSAPVKSKEVVVKPKPKPKPKPVVKIAPEQALASFQQMRSRDITDVTLNKFIKDMSDKPGLVEELNLSGSGVGPSSLNNIKVFNNLRSLSINAVKIDDSTLEMLSKMTQLEELGLDGIINLSSETLGFLENLVNLKVLTMNRTSITDEAFEALLNLEALEHLEFSDTKVNGRGFSQCRKRKKLNALKFINANSTRFGDLGFVGIQGLDDLEVLLVRKAIVTDNSLRGLKGCKSLKRIDLGYNTISDKGIKELSRCKNLENVNLHNTKRVSDLGLKSLSKLKNLTEINLTGTRTSNAGYGLLKKNSKELVILVDDKRI